MMMMMIIKEFNCNVYTLWGIKTHHFYYLLQYLTDFDRNWSAVSWITKPQSIIKFSRIALLLSPIPLTRCSVRSALLRYSAPITAALTAVNVLIRLIRIDADRTATWLWARSPARPRRSTNWTRNAPLPTRDGRYQEIHDDTV